MKDAGRLQKVKTNKIGLKVMLALSLCLMPLFLAGCGNPDIDISAYGDQTVTLIGLNQSGDSNGDITLKINELKEMDLVTVKTHSTSDKIGEVKATGTLLETVLKQYGTTLSDYHRIVITATDGYVITLNQPLIGDNELILAFGIGGKPLGIDEAPLRLIIPGSDSAYWIRMIKSIEFVR